MNPQRFFSLKVSTLYAMPSALCPYALCAMPHALCVLRYALNASFILAMAF